MEDSTANSFAHFIEIIEKSDCTKTIYRGEPSNNTPLIPKLGRLSSEKKNVVRDLEQKLYCGFVARAHTYLDFEPKSKCEWLAVAQHYGLGRIIPACVIWSRTNVGGHRRQRLKMPSKVFVAGMSGVTCRIAMSRV